MLLARMYSFPNHHCYAKQETLALELGLSIAQVKRDVADLAAKGDIKIERPVRRGTNHCVLTVNPEAKEHFTKHPEWLRMSRTLNSTQKRVLAYAYRRAGRNPFCQLKPKEVAAELGITPQHVPNVCRSLEEQAFLYCSAPETHSYGLLFHEDMNVIPLTTERREEQKKRRKRHAEERANVTPLTSKTQEKDEPSKQK